MSDDTIALKLRPSLWRCRVVDTLLNPKMVRNLNISGPASVKGAIDTAMHSDGYKEFQEQYPQCALAVVEFAGQIDS